MARDSSKRIRDLSRRTGSPPPPLPGRGDEEEDKPVETAVFVMVSLLVLLGLIGAAVIFGTATIERDLESRAAARFAAEGLVRVRAVADGRDLTVLGDVSDPQDLSTIEALVGTLTGARSVAVEVRVLEAGGESTTEIAGRTLSIMWDASGVTVSGDVSDSATRQTILGALSRNFRGAVSSEDLVILEGIQSEAAWLNAVVSVIEEAGDKVTEGQITINPDGVMALAGEMETRQERAEFRADIEERLSAVGFDFVSGLTLVQAPPPPPRQQVIELQEDLDDLIEGKVVEFEINRDIITARGRVLLDEIFEALQKFPNVPIEIAGHADAQGSDEANLDLSLRRAQAVLQYLVDKGAVADRFVVIGYGETRPIADNTTEEGRQRNRRIEFIALEE